MPLRLLLVAILCLSLSVPPAAFGWSDPCGLLVLPGWMAFYMLASHRRPLLSSWLIGLVHMTVLSWSLFSSFYGIVPAIAAVGGLYYLLAQWWTRRLAPILSGPVAFGCALAISAWLRANVWDIQYPHSQPAHSLYLWPALLGCVRFGGEAAANFLVGFLAAGLVDFARAWRTAAPSLRAASVRLGIGVLCLVAPAWHRSPVSGETRDVVLIEPRLQPADARRRNQRSEYDAWLRQLMQPVTQAIAGPHRVDAPALVVWPESIALHILLRSTAMRADEPDHLLWHDSTPVRLASGTRLLAGGSHEVWNFDKGPQGDQPAKLEQFRGAALLTDHEGRYLGHYEKVHLVAGGERQPRYFQGWLVPLIESAMGQLPSIEFGRPDHRGVLSLDDGTRFGVLICFDNAFPDLARQHRLDGARFLVVISNEMWFARGSELQQMVAMSVFRALETGLPVVRCTVDGWTGWVDADGRIREQLGPPEPRHVPTPLRIQVPLAPKGPLTSAWLQAAFPWLCLGSGIFMIPGLRRSWGKLLRRSGHGVAVPGA